MASPSSSMSQESLDHEERDTGFTNRAKSRNIRLMRARGALRTDRDIGESYDTRDSPLQNGDMGDGEGCGGGLVEHDITTRAVPATRDRPKDKRTRPNHLQRGKLPKDKRKLREKRRSTGVVHLQSTESTGDSLDDEDTDKERPVMETTRNTKYNEIIDADNPQTPSESHGRKSFAARRNKSPSDLEADLEDNQDYDSTVSQSECNLVLIDQKDSVKCTKPVSSTVSHHSVRAPGYSKIGYSYEPLSVRNESQANASYKPSVLSTYSESEPYRPRHVPSVLSRYQPDRKQETSYKSDFGLRFRDRDITNNSTNSRVQLPKETYSNSKTFGSTFSSRQTEPQSSQVEMLKEENKRLEKLLEEKNRRIGELEEKISVLNALKEENKRLEKLLEEKNRRIGELEEKISVLNAQMIYVKEQNDDVQGENSALLRALTRLTAQ